MHEAVQFNDVIYTCARSAYIYDNHFIAFIEMFHLCSSCEYIHVLIGFIITKINKCIVCYMYRCL